MDLEGMESYVLWQGLFLKPYLRFPIYTFSFAILTGEKVLQVLQKQKGKTYSFMKASLFQ